MSAPSVSRGAVRRQLFSHYLAHVVESRSAMNMFEERVVDQRLIVPATSLVDLVAEALFLGSGLYYVLSLPRALQPRRHARYVRSDIVTIKYRPDPKLPHAASQQASTTRALTLSRLMTKAKKMTLAYLPR
jgi:hypothetical protein